MRVVFTRQAEADLETIGDWIARDNPPRAVTFVQELIDACAILSDAPKAYPFVARFKRLGIRRRPTGEYLIFYRILSDTIEVLHVVHGARDYEAILSENWT
jgi:toxin ParE1/3/4